MLTELVKNIFCRQEKNNGNEVCFGEVMVVCRNKWGGSEDPKRPLPGLGAKAFLHRYLFGSSLVTCVALGAREGVNILIVEVTFLARHLQFSPYRFGEAWGCRELFLA